MVVEVVVSVVVSVVEMVAGIVGLHVEIVDFGIGVGLTVVAAVGVDLISIDSVRLNLPGLVIVY